MKRRPMLFHKAVLNNQGRRREVIGLIGTHHGVGVTHTALMLAFYMGEELGKRTALLECNNHHDLELIQKAYEWNRSEPSAFFFRKITCYKEVAGIRIPEIYGEDYECLILDFGQDFQTSREEFLRCTTKIVISGSAVWDVAKLRQFARATEKICDNDSWLYIIPQANDKQVTRISKELHRKVWYVPRTEEPTVPSRITCRFFGEIFQCL